MTRYRRGANDAGKIWIEIDGQLVAEFDSNKATVEELRLSFELRDINRTTSDEQSDSYQAWLRANRTSVQIRKRQGLFTWFECHRALEDYLSMSIEDVLSSDESIVRAIGFLDRRVGKRRLALLELRADELEWSRKLYEFRCEAEGIETAGKVNQLAG